MSWPLHLLELSNSAYFACLDWRPAADYLSCMARNVATSTQDVSPRRIRAADEAVMTLTKPIANWQAKLSWKCACWGLIPAAGLILGSSALLFGVLGWRRVRRFPDDLGIRQAVGG